MSSTPEAGRLLGRYQLLYMLGQGGMGEVHLAKLTGAAGFEKLCIVKMILPSMQSDPQFVDRFHHEARVLVQLNHSNIAQVYDMGEVDGSLYMAIEYVSGVDLSRVMSHISQRGAVMPVPIALYLCQQVAEALGYAHRKTGPDGTPLGIVHRDVSPQNVMVSYEGEIKVIDFGLAKSSARAKQTLPATVMGKLGYMSPEQALARSVDHRSDIFSAGIVLWELLAGRSLYPGGTMAEMVAQMANSSIPPLRPVRPEISPTLEQTVMRALAKDPSARFTRADDFARALNELAVREHMTVGAEEVGNYVKAMCPDEFQAERRLQSQLSILRKKGGGAADLSRTESSNVPISSPLPAAAGDGTFVRPSEPGTTDRLTPAQVALTFHDRVVAKPPRQQKADPAVDESMERVMVTVQSGRRKVVMFLIALAAASIMVGLLLTQSPTPTIADRKTNETSTTDKDHDLEEAKPDEKVAEVASEKGTPDDESPQAEKPSEPAPTVSEAPKREPQILRMADIVGSLNKVLRKGDEAYIVLEPRQKYVSGDKLLLVGEAVGKRSRERPVFGDAVIFSVNRSLATLLIEEGLILPDKIFAGRESQRMVVQAPKEPPMRAVSHAEVKTESKTESTAARLDDATTLTVEPPQQQPAAIDIANPFDDQRSKESQVEKPVPPPAAKPSAASIDDAAGAKSGVKQILGQVRFGDGGANPPQWVYIRNGNAFSLKNCQVRLPMNRYYLFGGQTIFPRQEVKISFSKFHADTRAADPRFKEGWSVVYCSEGNGYFWTTPK